MVVLRPVQPLYLRARDELGTFTITCNDAAVLVVASDGLISVYIRLGCMGDTENYKLQLLAEGIAYGTTTNSGK